MHHVDLPTGLDTRYEQIELNWVNWVPILAALAGNACLFTDRDLLQGSQHAKRVLGLRQGLSRTRLKAEVGRGSRLMAHVRAPRPIVPSSPSLGLAAVSLIVLMAESAEVYIVVYKV